MKKVKTHIATIHLGLRELYGKKIGKVKDVKEICQNFVNAHAGCVSVTPCDFIYTRGNEPGLRIELINYPRFPSEAKEINAKAIDLAGRLMIRFRQNRITITTSDGTFMLENETLT